ncbi:hypothetical protein ACFY3G_15150 [Streptomyces phaeochromogenes]|uniref:hypothetical protein n=1 Tax=Streptomyces phaeochromogenes TaxID=1923 RepID=UPI0036963732
METAKGLVAIAALIVSVTSFFVARLADSRAKKAEDVRNLLGSKESVSFGALKLLRDGLPNASADRKLVIAALMQACVLEGSDRARALLYRVIEENRNKYGPEFRDALQTVTDTFASMSGYRFTKEQLDLGRGELRVQAVHIVLSSAGDESGGGA